MKKKGLKNNKLTPLVASVLMAPLCAYAGEALETSEALESNTISVTGSTVSPDVIRLKKSPITSVVVGKAQLDKIKFTNTSELLNRIPGVSKSRNLRVPHGGKGYTIPLVDGFSVRDPYRGAVGQIEDTNPSDIERIEVIYGPGSALYGSNAFGGVINVITKEPPKEQESRAWVEGGDFERTRAGVSTTGTVTSTLLGDVGYFLDASYWNLGDYRDDSFDDRKMVSGKLVFHPSIDSKLWIRGEHLERQNQSSGSLKQAEYDANDKQSPGVGSFDDGETNSASIGYSMDTDQGELKLGYAIRHDEGHSLTSYGGESDYEFLDMNFKAQYRHDFQGIGASDAPVSLTTGIELIDGSNEKQGAGRRPSDQDIDKFVYAPFAQLEVMATDKLKATLGLRYENVEYDAKDLLDPTKSNKRVFKKLSPKLGITYDLTGDDMVFAGISKGFAPPSRNQIFTDTYSNPNLAAEVATNYEVGFRGAFLEQNLSYDIGLYYMDIKDYISNEYVETVREFSRGRLQNVDKFRPVNAGKVSFRGLEAQLEYEPLDFLRFGVSYTYARNKFVDFIDDEGGADEKDLSGNYLASSPKHHINTRVTLIPMTDLEIELEMDAYSGSYTNSDNDLDPQGRFDQENIFNLRVNYETGPVELWLTALNITDKKHATRVSYRTSRSYSVGDGRSLYAGVAYNF